MSDSYERSYYEIALTNSQVLSALAVLLLCLLGSFVAGMWVAREASPESANAAATEGSQPEAVEGQAEPFRFFERRSAADGESPEPTRSVAPVEVAERDDSMRPSNSSPPDTVNSQAAQVGQPDVVAQQTVAPKTQSDGRTVEPSPVEAKTADRRSAEKPKPAPPAQSTAASEPADQEVTHTAGMVVIQVLSSNEQSQAGGVLARLRESGYRAFISPVEVEGRTMYRVRVGPYAARAQAESAALDIKKQFRLDTWITASG